ncbi:MAG: hypothetical protein M9894_20675 [Planctomycetes bacterium]|nr:hypothetical protein [Planctomycetota bacterium]
MAEAAKTDWVGSALPVVTKAEGGGALRATDAPAGGGVPGPSAGGRRRAARRGKGGWR